MSKAILFSLLAIAVALVAVAAARRRGPRITRIEHRRDEGDEQ